jgi:hypothetical protein
MSRNSDTRSHASVTNSSDPLISSPIEAAKDNKLPTFDFTPSGKDESSSQGILYSSAGSTKSSSGSGVKNRSLGHPLAGSVSLQPWKSTMAWGLATAVGALNDALQRWDFGLVVYRLYETKPLSDSPVSRFEKKRKHFRDILCYLMVLRPNNTA